MERIQPPRLYLGVAVDGDGEHGDPGSRAWRGLMPAPNAAHAAAVIPTGARVRASSYASRCDRLRLPARLCQPRRMRAAAAGCCLVECADSGDVVGDWCESEGMELNTNRFYDGGTFEAAERPEPADPDKHMRVCLERKVERPEGSHATAPLRELFTLGRRIAYQHHDYDTPFIVPTKPGWKSDLTSVPWFLTWVVPRSGMHLPAALVHDALIDAKPSGTVTEPGDASEDTGACEAREPYIGPYVSREEADRLFRDAMADLGTGTVRRWLAWTGVTLNTMNKGLPGTPRGGGYYRWAMRITLGVLLVLGMLATMDLFDAGGRALLPWMFGSFGTELLGGALGAVVFAGVAAVVWWRFWKAGAIAGLALALLLHVSVVLVFLSLLLAGMERLTVNRRARALGLPVPPPPPSPGRAAQLG